MHNTTLPGIIKLLNVTNQRVAPNYITEIHPTKERPTNQPNIRPPVPDRVDVVDSAYVKKGKGRPKMT
ncbi:hypothetical protein IEQ34_001509 [Dendrobium chrysotoxum]|uniref:Uncharacterized protein n=1 Tax=Dendrobium chrysotoxum TaxID=161865 RepID=A0AAV7HLG2_DENCH|nr:hypothetical protein IEQ34_001509 [Dendrobium chrysotoxum]